MSIERGTEALLTRRREQLAQGAKPIGWKAGFNAPRVQRMFGLDAPVVGYLTTDGLVEDSWDDGPVLVESEVAVEVGPRATIAALLPAFELADPPDFDLDLEQILAGNIFHRGVAFGPRVETREAGPGRIFVNGELQHELTAEETAANFEIAVKAVAERLEAAGEELRAGDRIITGVLGTPHEAAPGDTVRFELDQLGSVELRFS
jgi:2-keto-4-pentenoate hydratase